MRFSYVNVLPETLCTTATLPGSWFRNALKRGRFGRVAMHFARLERLGVLIAMVGIEVKDKGLHRAAPRVYIRLCRSIMLGDCDDVVSESGIRGKPSEMQLKMTSSYPRMENQLSLLRSIANFYSPHQYRTHSMFGAQLIIILYVVSLKFM